ncbi:MAG: STAS domain-containing protein [Actinomycetota bacterium]|nr:STAS domain-containing protein [Actinomycetota bacterium]
MTAENTSAGGAPAGSPNDDRLEIDEARPGDDPDELVLVVHGEIDTATSPRLQARLEDLPAEASVCLDLADVSFVDSSGLSALIAVHHRQRNGGGRLRFRALNDVVARLFAVTGLDRHLDIADA